MNIRYYQIKPYGNLSGHVKFFWVGEVDVSRGYHFTHFSIATNTPKLVFHYKGKFDEVTSTGKLRKSFLSGIQGQLKTHARFISGDHVGIFGVEFYPYAVPSLFGIPAAALAGQYLDIETFLGSSGRELEDKIRSASTNKERVVIVTHFLDTLIQKPINPHIVSAMQRIDKSKGLIDINTLLKDVPLSQRQFERLFKEVGGFTPKLYARIARFEAAVKSFSKKTSFTEIALEAGYFDQAHFNHDFMAFAGLPPKAYLEATRELPVTHC